MDQHDSHPVGVVMASAGTGKTHTLTERIEIDVAAGRDPAESSPPPSPSRRPTNCGSARAGASCRAATPQTPFACSAPALGPSTASAAAS